MKNKLLFYLLSWITITNSIRNAPNVILRETRNDEISKLIISQYLPEKPTILEAGGYKGEDTIEMSQLWPESTIYTFEPLPTLFKELQENTQRYNNIICFDFALGNKIKKTPFFVSTIGHDGSSSILEPEEHLTIHPEIGFAKKILVNQITIDAWAEENNIKKIDFLWLDLQGAEPLVLQASPKILQTVSVIYTEVNFKEMYKNCILFTEFKNWLVSKGFKLIHVTPQRTYGTALFVRNDKH